MNNFIEQAIKTESPINNVDGVDHRLLHAAIGMATESAEFLDALKKTMFYNKPLDLINLKEELGDILWYTAIAMDALNTNVTAEQERVIAKLQARYPEKFTEEAAEHRDLEKEREVLERE